MSLALGGLFGRTPLFLAHGTLVVVIGTFALLLIVRTVFQPAVVLESLREGQVLAKHEDPVHYALAMGRRFCRTYHTFNQHTFSRAISRSAYMVDQQQMANLGAYRANMLGYVESQELTRNIEVIYEDCPWHDPELGEYIVRYVIKMQEWKGPFKKDPYHVKAQLILKALPDEQAQLYTMVITKIDFEPWNPPQ
jgi:hypothetical protein